MASNVLSPRDTNIQVKLVASPEKKKKQTEVKSLKYHREMLHSRLDDEQPHKVISPSDEIMSPATQKLQAFKNKHATKKCKPQTLFKKTSAKNFEATKGTTMFADLPKVDLCREENA